MTTPYILAIDQGTTGSTALLFDHAGSVKAKAYSEFTQHFPQPGWVEHDAEEIWQVTHRVVEQALDHGRIKPEDIHAIGITNQRETTVMWDRQTGIPVGRAIVWQDRRTAHLCDTLRQDDHWGQRITGKTGLLLDPYFSGTKVAWMLENVEGLREKAEAGNIAFGTIDSWLVYKLSGGRLHITDVTNASRTLLYNIYDLQWDREILEKLNIPETILPEVYPSSQVYGETDPQAFFGTKVPIAGMAGDQHAALFGQACYQEGMAKNTYGTGSFILMQTGDQPIASNEKLLTTIAWRIGDEPVVYALEGSVFISGAAVQWLRDGLQIIEDAKETEALASSLDSNDDVYFVPALAGLGAPHWDPYARGMITGLTRGSTRAHLVRAALEAIAYQARDVVAAMERDSGTTIKELRVDGGAVGNRFLMQFQSDILGVPVEVPVLNETTALGAAYLAGLATGFWSGRDELAAQWQRADRYEPIMPQTERERLYQRWLQAVERAQGWAQAE